MDIVTKWKLWRIAVTSVYLMIGWLIFSWSFDLHSLLLGFIFSVSISFISYDYFIDESEVFLKDVIPRIDLILLYVLVLLIKVYLASFDVVYRVITMKINPGEIRIRTRLKSDLARVFLANSITLTPGTVTVDIKDDYLYVHWLSTRTTNVIYAGEIIKGHFELWLGRIFR